MKLWVFPIEPLDERYSADWLRWWPRELTKLGVDHELVMGERLLGPTGRIEAGQFLDAFDTHHFKSTQLAAFARRLKGGRVRDGDWVMLHDAWNPAVEQLAYIRAITGIDFKLAGLFHAGTWDVHDHIHRVGMRGWGKHVERAWFEILDKVFVATEFHKELIFSGLEEASDHDLLRIMDKIAVTGFPLHSLEELRPKRVPWDQREPLVVFPHRMAPEKQPGAFRDLEALYRARYGDDGSRWLFTKEECRTKGAYYELLGRARVAVSTALQETWGIAMLEAVALGCAPVAPNRLSYPETMPGLRLYGSLDEAAELVHYALRAGHAPMPAGFDRWEGAIKAMVEELAR